MKPLWITTSNEQAEEEIDSIQTELDNHIAQLVFSPGEAEAEDLLVSYEASYDNLERSNNYETGYVTSQPLEIARQQFVDELKNLQPGESPAPAIERFLPAAILPCNLSLKLPLP